jgi:hypothetical protein
VSEPKLPAVSEDGAPTESMASASKRPLMPPALSSLGRPSPDLVRIVLLWAAWLVILCAFQIVVQARVSPARPDAVLAWTQYETGTNVLPCRPRIDDPNMNEHVAFDSEYYISIAAAGYDDPDAQAYSATGGHASFQGVPSCSPGVPDEWTSLNYAFMPGYPMAMRPLMAVEGVLPFTSDLTDTGKATLAGIIVSALGGLLAMLALGRLMGYLERRRKPATAEGDADSQPGPWGGAGGLRTALYLLVFPTGFYLAQVYTEGLFIGLAFMACALAVERKIVLAAVFAVLASLVRTPGFMLAIPLAWAAFEILRDRETRPAGWRIGVPIAAAAAPIVAFVAWFLSPLGANWQMVEREFFTRSFDPAASVELWRRVLDSLLSGVDKTPGPNLTDYAVFGGGNLSASSTVYIALEPAAIALGVAACLWLLRRMPGVALFGVGVIVLSAGSAAAMGMDRYVLAVPAIFLMLAWFGRRIVFDRAWVMASTLLMGMLAMLFTFGFWVS